MRELKGIFGDPDGAGGTGTEIEPQYQILIECKTEEKQVELLTKLNADGIPCRALIA